VSEISKSIRVIEIYKKLATDGYVTAQNIQKYFQEKFGKNVASIETIRRDIKILKKDNVIYEDKFINGHQKIWKLYSELDRKIIPVPFEFNQVVALFLLKNAMPLLKQTEIFSETESAYNSLLHLIPGEQFEKFEIIETLFYHKEFGTLNFAKFDHIVSKLMNAIIERKICEIAYKKNNEKTSKKRLIKPHKFIYYKGVLYVIVYNDARQSFYTLSLSRISEIKILDEKFTVDKKYNHDEEDALKFGLTPPFENTGVEHIVIKVGAGAADYFENINWHATQKTRYKEDGSLIFEMDSYINDELLGWILGWKDNIQVLQPKILIDLILEKIKKIEKKYLNGQNMTDQLL
jgi:predicted DNA-binding transcriptional regulator YafY